MRKVDFVEVESEITGYGFGKGLVNTFDGCQDIIRERIEAGWDYKGYIPTKTRGTGEIEVMTLIFQKEED